MPISNIIKHHNNFDPNQRLRVLQKLHKFLQNDELENQFFSFFSQKIWPSPPGTFHISIGKVNDKKNLIQKSDNRIGKF